MRTRKVGITVARWALSMALVAAVATRVHAADATAASAGSEPKIGYVDMPRALNEVDDGRSAKAKLKGEFDLKQKKLDKMQSDFKGKKDEFDKRAEMMKADARASKEQELQRDVMEIQRTYMQLQQELAESEKQVTDELNRKLRAVIEKVGDRDGYFLILNIGETVLYNKRHMDITDEAIREYNKLYGTPKK